MNTCAECRFWKDVDDSARSFTFNPARWRDDGEYKECVRAKDETASAFMATVHSYDDALMTRSDFGCVQFEKKPVDLKGIPVSDAPETTGRIRIDTAFSDKPVYE